MAAVQSKVHAGPRSGETAPRVEVPPPQSAAIEMLTATELTQPGLAMGFRLLSRIFDVPPLLRPVRDRTDQGLFKMQRG